MVALAELTGCDRSRSRLVARRRRHGDGPDVGGPIAIDKTITGDTVGAVDRFGDHPHVAFPGLVAGWLVTGRLRRGRQIRWPCGRREDDRLAVGRPLRIAGAARDVRDGPRFAPGHRHDVDLRRLRSPILLDRSDEGQPPAVRRPPRSSIADAARNGPRRFAAIGFREPEGRVVRVLLFVGAHAHERHL